MKKLLTAEQVAEHLQIQLQSIYKWLRNGYLPGIKIGRRWRIREKDLKEFFEKAEAKAGEKND